MGSGSEDLYNRKFTGKLKLKGLSKTKLQKQKDAGSEDIGTKTKDATRVAIKESRGSGRIFSSGNTIQGFDTKFVEELAVGDMVIVRHPTSNEYEERTVQSILSNRTLCVDEAFSRDLITTTAYLIRKKPTEEEAEAHPEAHKEPAKKSTTVTIREKSGMWSYRTTTKTVKSNMTAEERLDERVKHSRDKYCW